MNNLTAPVKFMEVMVETASPLRCVTRFVLRLSWTLFLLALPGRAQTPASEQKTITLEELQQMALQNNPTFAQAAANIRAAEGRKKQSGLYPNPTVGYQGEQIRGGSFHGGEQGFFLQQDVVLGGKLGLNRKIFDQELKQAETEAEEQKLRVVTNVRMFYIQALAVQQTVELRQDLSKLADDLGEKIVNESPAVRIAELGVKRAEAALARAKREPIPDLQLRGGMQQNGELLSGPNGRSVGLQGFANVGVRIPIFDRNQGNIATAKADVERCKREVERVKLVLRERAASVVQTYTFSQTAVDRYKNQMIPRAQKAHEMYTKKYQDMAAAYPQVLISQRTLAQLEVSYITALENFATSSLSLQSYLLTDGLEAPSQPGGIDRPVREVNIPFQMSASPQ